MMALLGTFTGLGVAPQVVTAVPLAANRVLVQFSESMLDNGALVLESNYVITEDLGSDPVVVSDVTITGWNQVVLTVSPDLSPGTNNYSVSVTGVSDLAYNVIGVNSTDFSGPGSSGGAIELGWDRSGPVDITFPGFTPGRYYVHLGPLGSVDDPNVISTVTGARTEIEFVNAGGGAARASGVYLPTLPVGTYQSTVIPVAGGPAIYPGTEFRFLPRALPSRSLALRQVLPPWYRTGVRSIGSERYPQ